MQAGDERGVLYWRPYIAILAANPNIAARRAALVAAADEDEVNMWRRAENLNDVSVTFIDTKNLVPLLQRDVR